MEASDGRGSRRRRHGRVVGGGMAGVVGAGVVAGRAVPRERAAVVVVVHHVVVHAGVRRVHVGGGLRHGGQGGHRGCRDGVEHLEAVHVAHLEVVVLD